MKYLNQLILLAGFALLLTACGESTSDQPLPQGTAPNEAPATPEVDPQPAPEPEAPAPATEPIAEPDPEPVAEPETLEVQAQRSQAPGISYVLPEGWSVGPEKPMRLLTLVPAAEFAGVELAISKWPGDVGGFAMNITRWARQAGVTLSGADLSSAAASGYEQFKLGDTTATWLPLMNEQQNTAILAVWAPRGANPATPTETWTFKLTCKADQVQALAPAVRAWCESVKFED